MALLDLQTALGRLVRVPDGEDPFRGLHLNAGERVWLTALVDSAGFRFTVDVQRSWCEGRATKAAKATLSILRADERERLVTEWVKAGGGTASFFAAEAEVFLDFIAGRLPDPSHALTLCRVERATLRAREGALRFTVPNPSWLGAADSRFRRGQYATMVRFYAEPRLLLAAMEGQPLPPVSRETTPVLFGPNLNGFSCLATAHEVALWERLAAPEALSVLLQEGHRRDVIKTMVAAGVLEGSGIAEQTETPRDQHLHRTPRTPGTRT